MSTPPALRARLLRARVSSGPLELEVAGASMGSSIVDGDRVRIVAAQRPRRGQVWAFVADDGTVLVHRCRRVGEGTVVLQGDGNLAPDRPVELDKVIGRVVAIDRGAGFRELNARDRVRGWSLLLYRDLRTSLAQVLPGRWRRWLLEHLPVRR